MKRKRANGLSRCGVTSSQLMYRMMGMASSLADEAMSGDG
jgi:hypothetical protein